MLSQQTRILYKLHKKYQENPSSLTQDEKFISEVAKKMVEKYGTPSFLDDTQPLEENSGLECPLSLCDIRYPCVLEYTDKEGSISTYVFEEQYILRSLTLSKTDPTNRQPVKDQVIKGKELRFLLCFNKYFETGISELYLEIEQERIKQLFYRLGNEKKQEQRLNTLKDRLLQAFKDKNLQEVKELIKDINDLNVALKSDSGYFSQPLLYYFFQNALSDTGWFNFFKDVLSERKIELNIALNEFGSTALHFAVRTGHLEMAKLLLENGAGVDTPNNEGETPLHSAARAGHLEIVRLLVNNRADVNAVRTYGHTPIIAATVGGHIDIIKELYANGANINAVNEIGWTALRYVAQNENGNNLEVVKALLECENIDVNIPDNYGNIPLCIALLNRRSEISKLLVEQTCNAASQEVKNKVLLAAAEAGELEVARLLLKHGANVNTTDKCGYTPIFLAAVRGHIEVIKTFYKEYGADINAVTKDGWTALRYVVQNGWCDSNSNNLEAVKALLECGKIDVHIPDNHGQTPLQIATKGGNTQLVQLLHNYISGCSLQGSHNKQSKNNRGNNNQSQHNCTGNGASNQPVVNNHRTQQSVLIPSNTSNKSTTQGNNNQQQTTASTPPVKQTLQVKPKNSETTTTQFAVQGSNNQTQSKSQQGLMNSQEPKSNLNSYDNSDVVNNHKTQQSVLTPNKSTTQGNNNQQQTTASTPPVKQTLQVKPKNSETTTTQIAGQGSNNQTQSKSQQGPMDSQKSKSNLNSYLGFATAGFVEVGIVLCATGYTIVGGAIIAFTVVSALIGYGVAKICEKVTEEKEKKPEMSTLAAIKTVLKNTFTFQCERGNSVKV